MWSDEAREIVRRAVDAYILQAAMPTARDLVEHVARSLEDAHVVYPSFSAIDLVPFLPTDTTVLGLERSLYY